MHILKSSAEAKKRIPCSHCFALRNPLTDVFEFSFQDCVEAVSSGKTMVYLHADLHSL